MKKSETNACLIAGVLATSLLLTGCGGGSGGGISGLGGATGATGAAGAPGTIRNLVDLLGSTGGANLNLSTLGENVNVRALTPEEVAALTAQGFTGFTNVEVIDRSGQIIGINSPAGSFGLSTNGVLPTVGGVTLPALPGSLAGIQL